MIYGRWHPKDTARSLDASLVFSADGYELFVEESRTLQGLIQSLHISDRLGNVERKIVFEDGSVFFTKENDRIDAIVGQFSKHHTLLHRLESHMGWIAVALVVTVVSVFGFVRWGIPWTSQKIAHALPYSTNEMIASNSMEFLDKYMFEESNLSVARQEQIRGHFIHALVPTSSDKQIRYRLHFRKWEDIPNALALPSGDIIVTDKFIELSQSQEEIDSVLLHEMGHVVYRHGMETVVQSALMSAAVLLIVGDVNTVADMGVGLGTFLVNSSYSRDHESEADIYAFEKMLHLNIDPEAFVAIMERMTQYMEKQDKKVKREAKGKEEWTDYLSTHPTTQKRIEIAARYSQCLKNGQKECKLK